CVDTIHADLTITEKPPVNLAFRDTLICLNDKVQLKAKGGGTFTWSPILNIIDENTPSPTVAPTTTTTYYVDMNESGCLNRDSVLVNVVDHVSLEAMNDSTICKGDAVQLRIVSDGLHYSWNPASQLNDSTLQMPVAITNMNTRYTVTAVI